MPYIGKEPANSFISFEKQVFTIVNSQTAYTLDNAVTNENDIRLVINNIVQEPGSGKAYTASGTTLTLSAALVNGTDEMYCVFLGKAVQTVNTPDGSINNAKLSSGSFSNITGVGTLSSGLTLSDNILFDTASKGIYLGVTSANAAHLLDDYEEGDFTPEITDGIGSRTHSVQEGVYTKIGRICKFKLRVKLSSGSANSNRIGISGLPFTVFTDPPADGAYWSYLDSSVINSTSTNPPSLYQSRNTSSISFYKTSGADFTGNDLNSATPDFYIVGTYQTN